MKTQKIFLGLLLSVLLSNASFAQTNGDEDKEMFNKGSKGINWQ
jgi:hypothetical protein